MSKIVLVGAAFAALAALAALPAPAAANHCTGGEDALLAIPYPMDDETRYVSLDPGNAAAPVAFYRESNGKPGLQATDGYCGTYRFVTADVNLQGAPL